MNKLQQLLEKRKSGAGLDSSRSGPAPRPAPVAAPEPCRVKIEEPLTGKYPEPDIEYIMDADRAADVIARLPADEVLGLDIETMKDPVFKNHSQAGLCPHLSNIRLVQVCPDPSVVYVFDVLKMGIDVLKGLWICQFVAHNAIFEMKHLYHAGITLRTPDCTLLQRNALYGGRVKLQDIAREYMKIDLCKVEQTSDWSVPTLREEQIRYAALDAWVVKIAHKNFTKWIASRGREAIYALMRDAQYAVAKMEYYGIHYDAATHAALIPQWKLDLQSVEKLLRETIGPGVKLSSNKQLSDFYKNTLDEKTLNRWEKTATGDLCMKKDVVSQHMHLKEVAPLAEYKRISKLISSFGEGLLEFVNPKTGRIHPDFFFAGAKSGRFSCQKPNIQQMPREKAFRKLFKAPEGRVLVVADYSQVELRVLALLSKDPTMLEAYENGDDLHRLTASKISGSPFAEVTHEQRSQAKAINFGLVYGMGGKGLAEYARTTFGVKMSIKKANESIEKYFQTYPQVKTWLNRVTSASRIDALSKTQSGRVVKLEKIYTQAKNYPVQGSAAEIMLAALHIIDREITGQQLDIQITCIVHDEIHLECPEALAEQAKDLLEISMVDGMLKIFPEASTKGLVEAKIAKSWGDAK